MTHFRKVYIIGPVAFLALVTVNCAFAQELPWGQGSESIEQLQSRLDTCFAKNDRSCLNNYRYTELRDVEPLPVGVDDIIEMVLADPGRTSSFIPLSDDERTRGGAPEGHQLVWDIAPFGYIKYVCNRGSIEMYVGVSEDQYYLARIVEVK